MYILDDIITYIRRLIKTPDNSSISDGLIIDYINRFWINDVDARIQLFDLKTKYQFMTTPGVDQYNMPFYNTQTESPNNDPQTIGFYPIYQGIVGNCYVNGINVPLHTQKTSFFNTWPNIIQQYPAVAIGNGGPTYTIQLPILPAVPPPNPPINAIVRGHVDMAGVMATGANVDPPRGPMFQTTIPVTSVEARVFISALSSSNENIIVTDSGQFLDINKNLGLLMAPGKAPFGNKPLSSNTYGATQNVINYTTGTINVTFPSGIISGNNINVSCLFFQTGLPRAILFYNNCMTLRNVPDNQYVVEVDAYLTPAAFLNTSDSIAFGYMSEYIARGAARKILSDTGDVEQLNFYEPLFREQEILVWKRSQRQWTATRTQTIYSQGMDQGQMNNSNQGGTI
jgi:hypothetical protein